MCGFRGQINCTRSWWFGPASRDFDILDHCVAYNLPGDLEMLALAAQTCNYPMDITSLAHDYNSRCITCGNLVEPKTFM